MSHHRHHGRSAGVIAGLVLLSACVLEPSPTPVPSPSATPTSSPTAPAVSASSAPTATPEPSFSLDLPEGTDARQVEVAVATDVDDEGGEIVVTVTSLSDDRVDELVLRWVTELDEAIFLAPFVPSEDRIRDNGPPLVQNWTKWVVGPGERGEPAGTTSLGYGPLMPGATLAIPIHVDRRASGPVEFDLQVLADNDILTLAGGGPATLRVEVP